VKNKICIGEITVDLERQQILKGDEVFPQPKRVQRLLLYFAANPNRVISQTELHEQVWDSRPVEQSVFSKTIWSVRQAIGDRERDVLRSIARQGYLLSTTNGSPFASHEALNASAADQIVATSEPLSLALAPSVDINLVQEASNFAPPIASPSIAINRIIVLGLTVLLVGVLLITGFFTRTQNTWVVVESSTDPEISAFVTMVLTRQFENSGISLVSNLSTAKDAQTPTLLSSVDVDKKKYSIVITQNGQISTYTGELNQSFEEITRKIILERGLVYSHALTTLPAGAIRPTFDFLRLQREIVLDFRKNMSSVDAIAWMAYLKNELGNYSAAQFFASEALSRSTVENSGAKCMSEYVIIDHASSITGLSAAGCAIAETRLLERQGDVLAARTVNLIDGNTGSNPVLALKSMELALQVGFDPTREQEIITKVDQLEAFAKASGWDAVLPRLHEMKAQIFALRLNAVEQKHWLIEAESGYRRLNDQTNGDRIACKRLRMQGALPQAEIRKIEAFLAASLTKNNVSTTLSCELTLLKLKWRDQDFFENASRLRKLIEQIPNNYERLEALLGLISQCGLYDRTLALKYSEELIALAKEYPMIELRALSQRAQFASANEVVQRFLDLEAASKEYNLYDDFTTSWCVASRAALYAQKTSLAQRWASVCVQNKIPKIAKCVYLYGASVAIALNRINSRPQIDFNKLINKYYDAWDMLPSNCATGYFVVATQILKTGNQGFAIDFYNRATSGQTITSIDLNKKILEGYACAMNPEFCKPTTALVLGDKTDNFTKGIILGGIIAQSPATCRSKDITQLRALAALDIDLVPRLHCVMASCSKRARLCKPLDLLGNY
jgi:DNA-binding winged helix-turn-helix (wHTH) protein